jgi:hypothetical protein
MKVPISMWDLQSYFNFTDYYFLYEGSWDLYFYQGEVFLTHQITDLAHDLVASYCEYLLEIS